MDALETSQADLESLLTMTNLPTVCLGTDLTVRWFTPAAQQLIRLNTVDRGSPLAQLDHDFIDDDLLSVVQNVLRELTPVADEVNCQGNRTFLRRVMPYRAKQHQVD